jgi:hypothetical protein
MVCGTCGATIAAKAIVCYRCGAATAIPAAAPKTPLRPAPRPWLVIIVLVIIAGVLGWLASAEPAGSVRYWVLVAVGIAAAAFGGYLAFRRRMR